MKVQQDNALTDNAVLALQPDLNLSAFVFFVARRRSPDKNPHTKEDMKCHTRLRDTDGSLTCLTRETTCTPPPASTVGPAPQH